MMLAFYEVRDYYWRISYKIIRGGKRFTWGVEVSSNLIRYWTARGLQYSGPVITFRYGQQIKYNTIPSGRFNIVILYM